MDRARRVPVTAKVQCRWDARERFVSERVSDISASGVFIRSEVLREVGTIVFLQLELSPDRRSVEALGRVARVGADSTGKQGMGVQFVAFDDESRTLVEALVASARWA